MYHPGLCQQDAGGTGLTGHCIGVIVGVIEDAPVSQRSWKFPPPVMDSMEANTRRSGSGPHGDLPKNKSSQSHADLRSLTTVSLHTFCFYEGINCILRKTMLKGNCSLFCAEEEELSRTKPIFFTRGFCISRVGAENSRGSRGFVFLQPYSEGDPCLCRGASASKLARKLSFFSLH